MKVRTGIIAVPSPLCGRGWRASARRVRGRGQGRLYGRPNAVKILQHIVIPKTKDTEALGFEKRGPARLPLSRMLAAIHFNDETHFDAKEIGDVAVDLDLLAEFKAVKLPVSKDAPELSLRVSRIPAQLSRPACQEMVPCHYAPSPRRYAPTLSRNGERVFRELAQIHA